MTTLLRCSSLLHCTLNFNICPQQFIIIIISVFVLFSVRNGLVNSICSRDAYAQLTTPPMLKSLDWTRSRVRRDHLISMGVPVNLDEVDSHRLSSLPPLRITTAASSSSGANATSSRRGDMGPPPIPRPQSAVDGRRPAPESKGKQRQSADGINGSRSGPVTAVPRQGSRERYGLEAKPILDIAKAEELCGLDESKSHDKSEGVGDAEHWPFSRLVDSDPRQIEEHSRGAGGDVITSIGATRLVVAVERCPDSRFGDVVSNMTHNTCRMASSISDSQADMKSISNGMISELIANAAKAKQAQSSGSGGVFRRSSTQVRPQSSSGTVTPRRVDSPAIR